MKTTKEIVKRIETFDDKTTVVAKDLSFNIMKDDGTILIEEWLRYIGTFKEGVAIVQNKNMMWNFINKSGKFISPSWFHMASEFVDGLALVWDIHKGDNVLKMDGTLLLDEWFFDITPFDENGFARVTRHFDAEKLLEKSHDEIRVGDTYYRLRAIPEGYTSAVRCDGEENFVTREGKFLSETWFAYVYPFSEGYANVTTIDGKNLRINTTGEVVE